MICSPGIFHLTCIIQSSGDGGAWESNPEPSIHVILSPWCLLAAADRGCTGVMGVSGRQRMLTNASHLVRKREFREHSGNIH